MSTALHLGREARISGAGFGAVVALHGLVLWSLLQMQLITLPAPLAVLSVSLLPPAEITRPEPEVVPPKPHPVEKRPTPQAVTQPAPLALQADATVAAPTVAAPIAVSPAPTFTASAAPAPSAPRFDAGYLDNPKPAYPGLSRKLGEQGRVVLRVRVDAAGLPLEVQVHGGSGFPRLDHAALETVRRWKFAPARLGKEAVAATVLVPIAFSLKD